MNTDRSSRHDDDIRSGININMWFILVVLLVRYVNSSPTMCHCADGQTGMSCPQPIQLNCPAMQCPSPPPCNPFPTLPPFTPPADGFQGFAQFTLPTLPPLQGSAFGGPQPTPLPLPVPAPANGQESLVPIQPGGNQYNGVQQQYQPAVQTVSPQVSPQISYGIGQDAQSQVNGQVENRFGEPILVDSITKPTTLPSESYVDADSPEGPSIDDISNNKFPLYENQPNSEFVSIMFLFKDKIDSIEN
ncbi:hypothetical protein DICVIV_00052 [Dictyocaulus viviparus]|uniref:Uncharacterized protein n=1 Tax=Dictyocaulus viviparus TaxID=29172 RepID=A0A0D8YC42_DICVI|nr:hypothetical protein DICVIV_00052 [Dictyocaulus viviparus]